MLFLYIGLNIHQMHIILNLYIYFQFYSISKYMVVLSCTQFIPHDDNKKKSEKKTLPKSYRKLYNHKICYKNNSKQQQQIRHQNIKQSSVWHRHSNNSFYMYVNTYMCRGSFIKTKYKKKRNSFFLAK